MTTAELTKADFQSDQETRWCPGCGDYAILSAVQGLLPELGVAPENTVFISGIGCAGRFTYYVDTYGMHSIHGRAPAVATGLVAARDDLSVWVVSGDGDALSIGGNHLIHSLRRNVPMKLLICNNRIYGLTKGQISPTSERGKVTKSTPEGSVEAPLDPISLALGSGATFVARTVDRDKAHMTEVLRAAAHHPGMAVVEILQNCPVFNDEHHIHVTDKAQAAINRIELVHGQPVRFGAEGERGVVALPGGGLAFGDAADAIIHDATAADPTLAFAINGLGDPMTGPVALGIFRNVQAPIWAEGVTARLKASRVGLGDADIDALLHEGNTWTVA
ncbi:unannotated protein [freshwater metagenome]|uniref:Unannotated protein n=1 Tax=freshwater metagenome TaxID=449393 RepID=A0A6J7IDM1_9ZZZZ|nr:2-oxoacid:ferredoxin oxidoreductase subunit beta [Actinomycetota bacterium]